MTRIKQETYHNRHHGRQMKRPKGAPPGNLTPEVLQSAHAIAQKLTAESEKQTWIQQ